MVVDTIDTVGRVATTTGLPCEHAPAMIPSRETTIQLVGFEASISYQYRGARLAIA